MSRRAVTWLLGTLLFVVLAPLAAIGALGGTAAGTRWLFDTAKPYLPDQLSVGEIDGTLFRGVVFRNIAYNRLVRIRRLEANLVFWALPGRRLIFSGIAIDGVEVTIEARGESPSETSGVPEVDLPFAIELPDLQVSDIRITGEEVDRSIDSARLTATFDERTLSVDEISVRSPWLDLDGSGRLRVDQNLDADVSLSWRYVPPSSEELAGRLTLSGSREGYDIEHQLTAPVTVTTRGDISLDPEVTVSLESRWDEWRLPAADDQILTQAAVLQTTGSPTDLDVELTADVLVAEYPAVRLAFAGNTDMTRARIDALEATTEGVKLVVDGSADWSAQPAADIAYRLSVTPSLLHAAAPPGQLELIGTVAGELDDAGPTATLAIEELSGVLNEQPVMGEALAYLAPDMLDLSEARLALGDNRLSLRGSAGETIDLSATLDLRALSSLDDRLAGRIDGQVLLKGQPTEPAISVALAGSELEFGENRAESAELTVNFADTDDVQTRLRLFDVHAATLVFEALEFEQTGGVGSHQFRLTGLHDSGNFTITGDGAYAEPDWSVGIRSADFTTDVLSDWSLADPLKVSVSARGTTVSPFCLASDDGLGRVCGQMVSNADSGVEGKIEVRRFPLAAIPISLPGDARLTGFLEAMFEIEQTADSLTAKGNLETVDAAIETVLDGEPYITTVDSARVGIDVGDRRLFADLGVRLDAGAGELNADLVIEDVMSDDSPMSGEVVVDIPDLAAIAFLLPDVANPTGVMDTRARIGGSRGSPGIDSRTRIREASFDVLPAGIRVTDMSLTMTQRDIENISILGNARSGEGRLSIEGASRLSTGGDWSAEIRLSGDDFELLRLPDWEVTASPDVRVEFRDELTLVQGTVTIPRATITARSAPETATTPSTDVVIHGVTDDRASAIRAYDVDLTTTLGDAVSFSGFGLSTGITGELRLTGNDESPLAGNGRLELRDGRYRAYGQNLVIERGNLTFNGPLDNPQLDIRAVRPIENADIVAGISITGTPSALRSNVFSEPPMSDAEALSYVLTGRPLSGGQTSSDADLLNQAAFALGLSKAGSVAGQVRAGLGLDTLEVDGGTTDGRIVAGKRIGDRLLVEYGYGIIDKLGTLLLRYQLSSRLMLESRTGSMSAVDLVYTVKRE